MTKKVNKTFTRTPIDQPEKLSFLKRFAMLFESTFIILITAALLYLTRYVDVPKLVMQLSTHQQYWQLAEIITAVSVLILGLLILLTRYNVYLRKKIKEQLHLEEEHKKLAFYDRLTNLPNQALCQDRLDHALAKAARNNTSIATLYISIEDFKSVNDKQGHDGGDKLLLEVSKRLTRVLRPGDTLARINGVEFIVILESLSPKDNIDAIAIANDLLTKLVKCYRISMQEVYITGNVGVAISPNDGEHSKELMKNADTAMCFAKEQSRNSLAFFSKELQEQASTKKKIAEQLRGALDREELELHYQPIVDAKTHNIIAVEALLRWNNEKLGELGPDVFIPIAEEIGIITIIGDWVLTQACQQNKTWQQQGLPNVIMSINLSVMQLALNNYASTVGASLEGSELEPQFLELEFTEKTLMKDAKQSLIQLRQLSALGVSIALDDFGTGYSSMQHLPKFSLNKLKIDRSFIKKLPNNTVDVRTVNGITALAKELGLQITAEGVETAEQCQFLENCKVDTMQGYFFSKPVSAEAFTALLQTPSWPQSKTA